MNWNELYKKEIIEEHIVSGIHVIELLESISNYDYNNKNYFDRVKKSLGFIPDEYREAALALFSNVFYIPKQILDQSYSYFWGEFLSANKLNSQNGDAIKKCIFFEVDPSGMISDFAHENKIEQRLHPDFFVRISNVDSILSALQDLFSCLNEVVESSYDKIEKLSQKSHWIILTDKALSGQSLIKDLERYIFLRDIIKKWKITAPKITIFAQIITSDAVHHLEEQFETYKDIEIKYAICFDESMKINSPNCKLFEKEETKTKIDNLCEWFVTNILNNDQRFDRMREKSGDNLKFGYRKCGLTLVDYDNCPTNSIPLLWYDNSEYFDSSLEEYKGPFPRIHSRIGPQNIEPSEDNWNLIFNKKDEILSIIKSHTYDK